MPVRAGYSVELVLDHAALVAAGKSLREASDLRIVRCNAGVNTELERVDGGACSVPRGPVTSNTSAGRVVFATQGSITASGRDSEYFAYYGNSMSGTGPNDPDAVYLWDDDFRSDTLSSYLLERAVQVHGTALPEPPPPVPPPGPPAWEPPTYDAAKTRLAITAPDNAQTDFYPSMLRVDDAIIEVVYAVSQTHPKNGTLTLVARLSRTGTNTHYYAHMSGGVYPSPGISLDTGLLGERNDAVYASPMPYVYWSLSTEHTLRYAVFGTHHKLWWSTGVTQPALAEATDATNTQAGLWGVAASQLDGYVKRIRVRRYLEPEPTVTVGAETARP